VVAYDQKAGSLLLNGHLASPGILGQGPSQPMHMVVLLLTVVMLLPCSYPNRVHHLLSNVLKVLHSYNWQHPSSSAVSAAWRRVMSFNVRMDTEKDGDNRWDNRKEVVAGIIRNQRPLAFGLQV
jgi:hypothetical protein